MALSRGGVSEDRPLTHAGGLGVSREPQTFVSGAAAGADGLGSGAPSAEEASSPTLRCGLKY